MTDADAELVRECDALREAAAIIRFNWTSPKRTAIADRLDALAARLLQGDDELVRLVNEQAEDEGLWFLAPTAAEAYVQTALRKLHAAVERARLSQRSTDAARSK